MQTVTQIVALGISHRTAGLGLRERVAHRPEEAVRAALELREQRRVDQAVVVSTCNRTEIYAVSACPGREAHDALLEYLSLSRNVAVEELEPAVYRLSGGDAVRQLYRVAAGLDSLLLGESEILGQVRESYRQAAHSGVTGTILNRLFQSALEVGKRVRAETDLGARPMSAAAAAVKLAEQIFGKLSGHAALVAGAGMMGEQVAEQLRNREIGELVVLNRTRDRAEELARRVGGQAADWSALEQSLESPDIVVCSVALDQPLLHRAQMERVMERRRGRGVFLIDLGVPRNIEPEVSTLYNVYLYDQENLGRIVEENRQAREREVPRAEAIIGAQVEKFHTWMATAELAALLGGLRERLQFEREQFLAEHLGRMSHLSAEERRRVEAHTSEMLDRILNEPVERLLSPSEVSRTRHDVDLVRGVWSE